MRNTSDRVRDTFGGTDQSPKRKRGVSSMPASHQRTRSLTLGALIALCIHLDATQMSRPAGRRKCPAPRRKTILPSPQTNALRTCQTAPTPSDGIRPANMACARLTSPSPTRRPRRKLGPPPAGRACIRIARPQFHGFFESRSVQTAGCEGGKTATLPQCRYDFLPVFVPPNELC